VVAGHCRRSYQFAALIARADGVGIDEEVLYLGTLLHDLGFQRVEWGKGAIQTHQ